jgi:hypothetical protein
MFCSDETIALYNPKPRLGSASRVNLFLCENIIFSVQIYFEKIYIYILLGGTQRPRNFRTFPMAVVTVWGKNISGEKCQNYPKSGINGLHSDS